MEDILQIVVIVLIILAVLCVVLFIFAAVRNRAKQTLSADKEKLWRDRKHTFLGLPLSFTVFRLTHERLFIKTGFFTTEENEVRLYRVLDMQLRETLWQKILGLGSIVLKTSDKSMKNFTIPNVIHPRDVKEVLSTNVEIQRKLNRVSNRELMSFDEDDDPDTEMDENFDGDNG
jgi:uncharacterized membrane protein YdbT with pleckstrin-like domain